MPIETKNAHLYHDYQIFIIGIKKRLKLRRLSESDTLKKVAQRKVD
jgi:hypothetical protein